MLLTVSLGWSERQYFIPVQGHKWNSSATFYAETIPYYLKVVARTTIYA
jgi:hypothetical protein